VFPGNKPGKPLSKKSMLSVMRRMNARATVHGFRSSFRVWAAEQTDCPKEIPEQALAHTIGSAVEAAYQRSDLFERRRALMQDWSDWCTAAKITKALNVVTRECCRNTADSRHENEKSDF